MTSQQVIPFEGKLPSYISAGEVEGLNDDLTKHGGMGFPSISIKGKIFTVVRGKEREVLMNPKDPDSAATSIEVVLIKANKGTSKVFYAKGYSEGAEAEKPDCWSNDGLAPDSSIERPQNKTCAGCSKNVFGSRIGENGGKGKACSDSVRMAVATPDAINDPYLLRVPPASIRPLGEYGEFLRKKGVGYNMVSTKIGFDIESPTPKLTFKPVGFLPEASYAEVKETLASDIVRQIIGAPSDVKALPKPVEEVKQEKKVESKKAETKKEPKPDPTKIDVGGLNLDDLKFDD